MEAQEIPLKNVAVGYIGFGGDGHGRCSISFVISA